VISRNARCNDEIHVKPNLSNKAVVAYGDYSSTVNCRTRISLIFQGIFETFRGISQLYLFIYLFIYSTISCVIPDDVPPNPDWETQV